MYFGHLQYRPSKNTCKRESGFMMIVLVFLMVGLAVAALYTAPALKAAVQRDKEEEMVHRGAQYARAVKKYYKKFGRYPANIEALEDTNHMRFLRKRYKDPFSTDGKWNLVRYGQVEMNATGRAGGTGTGFTGGQPGMVNIPGVTGLVTGQQSQTSQPGTGFGSTGTSSTGTTSKPGTTGTTGTSGDTGDTGGSKSSFGQPIGGSTAGQPLGGGAIIGVSSKSERESLRVVADKNHYKDWKFIYDPTMDRGGLIRGPYNPKAQMGNFPGATNPGQQIGTPIGQPAGGTGFNSGGFGQNPQQQSPGQNMPPDIQPQPNPR